MNMSDPSTAIRPDATRPWADQRVLVMGLGRFRGGLDVTRWLVGQGARVKVTDLADEAALADSLQALRGLPIEYRLGGHDPSDLDDADLVVVNPAVPKHRSPMFAEIARRGVAWTTEMNLFCARCPAPVVGITGTYGKSTTSVMLASAIRAALDARQCAWTNVHLGGNIGLSLLGSLGSIRESDIVVLEMSDAQLQDLPRIAWGPVVAVITNLHPHHLDRHGGWEGYVAAKLNIARDVSRTRCVVVSPLAAETRALVERILPDGVARVREVAPADPPIELAVPGAHNRANADCVLAICREIGVPAGVARDALRGYQGLAHRLQRVRQVGGRTYINDSKSTSPDATITAVESVGGPMVVIVGGECRDVPLTNLASTLVRKARGVVCVGASAAPWARALREGGVSLIRESPGLDEGIRMATALSRPGDTVLFSPGAPSFDRYANFEERGAHFIRLVAAL